MNGKLEKYLQKIEEFLDIDDKIITYKWISKTLRVHTNTAKQLLYAFTKSDSNHGKYLVTYVVAGKRADSDGLNFRLVTEPDLAEVKSKFSKISSTHVYSVQKGTIVSGSEIYNAEASYKLTEEEQRFSSILPGEEIARREIKVVPFTSAQSASSASSKPTEKKIGSSVQTSKTTNNTSSSKNGPEHVNKEEETPEPRRTSPRKLTPKKAEKPEKKAPLPSAKNGGIGALFKKQSATKKKDPPKKELDKPTKGSPEQSEKDIQAAVSEPKTKFQTPKNKRKKSKAKEDLSSKQRKRIRVASESEESSGESDADERFPSPEPEPERPAVLESEEEEEIIPSTPQERGRKRVRKTVDHTFEGDNGYIITKKEYVIESCSDDEVAEPAEKKKIVEAPKPDDSKSKDSSAKAASPVDAKSTGKTDEGKPASDSSAKGLAKKAGRPAKAKPAESSSSKQSSIMSFFKKK